MRHDVAVYALRFLGKPLDEGSAIDDLACAFGEWLALLSRHDGREIRLIFQDELVPATQYPAPCLARQGTPISPGRLRRRNGLQGFCPSHVGNRCEY